MNNANTFSYFDALKYIGSKWVTELWQQKYTVISIVLLDYVSSTSGENNDDLKERAKKFFENPLARAMVQCSNDLFECQRTLDKESQFCAEQSKIIEN